MYHRVKEVESTNEERLAEYNELVAALDIDDVHGICKHSFKLYSMLVGLPEHKAVRKDMRKHYFPNMREWRKTLETQKGDRESLAAYITIIKNAFKKFGYEL